MKTTTKFFAVMAVLLSVITIAVANAESNDDAALAFVSSVSRSSVLVQGESVPPAPGPVAAVEAPSALVPAVNQDSNAPIPAELTLEPPSVMMDSVVIDQPMMSVSVGSGCCQTTCCKETCCPTPCKCCPPTPTVFCLQDPCGCSHEACIEVPACCVGEEPCVTWKQGLFRRQIAMVCWACCDHEVKVIVCRSGKVKVRD